jgi:cytochrome b561
MVAALPSLETQVEERPDMQSAQPGRYSAVARWLHWLIALLIIWNVVSGIGHEALPRDQRAVVMGLHMSSGILILGLSVIRLLWRVTHRPPPLPGFMKPWQVGLAHATHWGFYALMIILPLSGWIMVSSAPFPIKWFGLVDLPKFGVTREDAITGIAGEGHEVLGFVMLAMVLLHIGAALWHQFSVRDNLMARMR